MKCIGLIGAMGWESTQHYFQMINQEVAQRLGGLASAHCIVYSFNFQEIANLQSMGAWHTVGLRMGMAAASLEHAGAELLVIATHCMHKVASIVESAVRIPLVHVADATADVLTRNHVSKVAMLGNVFAMEEGIFSETFQKRGLEIVQSEPDQRESVIRILMGRELAENQVGDSGGELADIILALKQRGAQGVVLGSRNMKQVLESKALPIPLFDSVSIHAAAAVSQALL